MNISYMVIPGVKTVIPKAPIARALDIIEIVSNYFHIKTTMITGKGRKKHIVTARQIAIWLIYKKSIFTITDIARVFNRDHATCISAMKQVECHYTFETEYRNDVNNLKEIVK